MENLDLSISIICVSNNIKQLNEELIGSLKSQSIDYEFVLLDNSDGKYSSAAQALNDGANRSTGKILVFSHQDIIFKTSEELRKFAYNISQTNIGDIVGTQGVRERDKKLWSNLTGGKDITLQLIHDFNDELIEVSCVDEGLFGMRRETWEEHHFDDIICDNWHLYCVEACLYARKNHCKIFVSPIQVHHSSMGHITIGYMENLKRLCNVYRSSFKYIWTTCYKVRTNPFYINLLIFAWKANRLIRRRSLN